MNYYSRRWYPRTRRNTRSSVRRSHTPSSPYGKSLQFVRAEFFQLDVFTFERFVDFYAMKYGDGPKQYLRRTYGRWRSGVTNMAGQTERRILECVPPFLETSKQFELLSFQIPSVIHEQKSAITSRHIRSSEMENIYRELSATVLQKEYRIDWFVKEVFPVAELGEFLNVFKYTMLDCLRQSYAQVREDLIMLHDFLPRVDGSVQISYHISLLDCPLDVDIYPPPGDAQLSIAMPPPRFVTRFREQYRTILLDHTLAQCKAQAIDQANRQVALSDLQAIIAQLERTKSDQEYDSTLEVQGHGGTLRIRLQKKNLLRLRYAIAKQTLKLILALGLSGVIVIWLCVKGFWPILICLGIISLGIISAIWGKLQELRTEVNEYERQRATRFTTD